MKVLDQSPTEDVFVQNPYALYDDILKGPSVRYWEHYGFACVFDAERVCALLRDRRLGRVAPAGHAPKTPPHMTDFYRVERHSMLESEPPSHTRLRGLVLRAFTSRRIQTLAPHIHSICDALLADLPDGPVNLLDTYCTALPVRIIARLLGVPEEMAPQLLKWSHAMVAIYMARSDSVIEHAANRAAAEFAAFLSAYIDARQSDPQDDLITQLIAAEADGDRLTRDEMISTCILLLNAGHEATVHTLGNAVKALLEHDAPSATLTNPAQIAHTVEEVLRYDPPLHLFTRFAYEDIDLGDTILRAGEKVGLVLGAAGRDPRFVQCPTDFDPFREPVAHSAFGGGLHFCVGAPLARLELQIGLNRLFAHAPHIRLQKPPRYADIYHFHGLKDLVVQPGGQP